MLPGQTGERQGPAWPPLIGVWTETETRTLILSHRAQRKRRSPRCCILHFTQPRSIRPKLIDLPSSIPQETPR